ncbi:DUF3526 domain-containing protein [Rapidithrix thailandica]|uniref:DUF3526 domain-containing protein n=1 Tax=Rapidithrix thailandica TaxID=413964 RepID=A0AAW9SKF6_9BACT
MVKSIARKEFISTLRDKRFVTLSALLFFLLLTATLVGLHSFNQLQAERTAAQETVREQWVNQPDRHPHRVAHYGSFVFRPKSGLSFLDFGIDSYTGVSVFLEAHRQNSANFSQAQQSGSLIRFGEMTVAFVLQMLLPLLIIFLCFGAFTQEKESGTLKILLTQGITLRQIAWAKIRGYSQVTGLITGPALLVAGCFIFGLNSFEVNPEIFFRLFLFLSLYAVYFFICIAGSVIVSALSKSSRLALVSLLGIWILSCIIIPKAASNLGAGLYPAPTKAQMDADVHEEAVKGIDGHNPKDKRGEALLTSLLIQYRVDSVHQLPVNFEGIVMAEGEEYSSKVYQKHFEELQQTFHQQNSIAVWAGFFNPYLALRQLSMGLAGADFHHYVHFQQEAESYRYRFVQRLNELQATHITYGNKNQRLAAETWSTFEPFDYRAPSVGWVLVRHLIPLLALGGWLFLLLALGPKLIEKAQIV